ncbi:uncharacterized protein MCYG_06074 [Microsporum canis CBS 113480]|uniref:Zn(2)-C6 fungal-type domain-containing protein n=1 Tax=Arthroderma otae (strain ATCC MYA-4605 / CBS 113480) TaxID=554155 RepID=C5FTQ2_ARTOC|nr:uncharacterized protein MCYG_06074 [Microsporum canis CBS 113480]EEQ33255.1 predicted protein [Microsporum canis CBS 113480]
MDHTFYKQEEETKPLPRIHPIATPATQPKREESEDAPEGKLAPNRLGVECETKTSVVPNQRRRTPVACARCRRRKIKCSGDLGNGEACSNCKSSGTTNCLFLRVNSSPLQTKASYSTWTYPFSNSTSLGAYGQQQAAYDTHVPRANGFSINTGPPGLPAYSVMQPGPEYGTPLEPTPTNRAPYYPPNYPIGYGDAPTHHLPFSSYVLPSSTGAGANAIYGTTASTKGGRLPTTSDPTNGVMYPDLEGNSSPLPSFPFLGRPSQNCTSSEAVTLLPAVNSLPLGQDRILPNPTTGRNNAPASILESSSATPTTVCTSITAAYKQAYQLVTENDTRPMTGNDTSSLPVNVKISSSPVDCGFGYIPLSNALQPCVTSAPFLVTEVVDTPIDFHQNSGEQQGDTKITNGKGHMDTYVSEYHHSTNHRPGSTRPSGGILVSGEVYQRPQYTTPTRNIYPVEKVTAPPHLSAGTSSCY